MSKLVSVLAVFTCWLAILPSPAVSASSPATSHYERPSTISGPYKERVIVFVHGIFGDADNTWRFSPNVFWPKLLLADDAFRDSDVYVASYPTPYFGNSMNVDEVVTNLNNRLVSAAVFSKHREVIFVCHSMGGLIVQRLLLTFREHARQVPFIYFFSTPETGAQIARLGSVFSADPLLREMFPGDSNDYLLNLENEWRGAQFHIHRFCAYEKKKYKGVLVVDRLSGTRNCDEPPIAVNEDHLGIVKPNSAEHDSYIALRNAVLANPLTRNPPRNIPKKSAPLLPRASLEFTHTAIVGYAPSKSPFVPDYPVKVHVVYANTKDGTASEVYAQCVVLIFSGSLQGDAGVRAEETGRWNEFANAWQSNVATDLVTDHDIAGHDKSHFCLAQTPPLHQDEAQRLSNQIDVTYIFAALKWRDGTGQYESTICTFYLPKEETPDPKAPAHWRGCLTGHNIIGHLFKLSYASTDSAVPEPRTLPKLEDCKTSNGTITDNIYRDVAVPDLSSFCHSSFDNNLTLGNGRPTLKIGGEQNEIAHNTFPEMNVETTDKSKGNKLQENLFQNPTTPVPTAKSGVGADTAKIRAAQRANVFKCPSPCGPYGPYPDTLIEGLPSNLPLAKALHGSSGFVADQLSLLIDEGNAIVDTFLADNDMEALSKNQVAWQAKVETVVANLDPRLGDALTHVRSGQFSESNSHNQAGINICKSIMGKIDVLTIYQNQLRGVGD